MKWVGHVAYMGCPRNVYKTAIEGTKLKETRGRYDHMEKN